MKNKKIETTLSENLKEQIEQLKKIYKLKNRDELKSPGSMENIEKSLRKKGKQPMREFNIYFISGRRNKRKSAPENDDI